MGGVLVLRRAALAAVVPVGDAVAGGVCRDTVTLEVFGTYKAQTTEPPPEILDRIRARRPGWGGKA